MKVTRELWCFESNGMALLVRRLRPAVVDFGLLLSTPRKSTPAAQTPSGADQCGWSS
jgi:hypothetical protein